MDIVVTGVKEIDAVLKGLPLQLNHRIIGAALAQAAKPLVARARELAPVRKGTLRTSIASVKVPISRASSIGQVAVGPRLRLGGYKGHWIEYGTKVRRTKKGANRGMVKAAPFMRPAFDQLKDTILSNFNVEVGQKLLAFMKRTIKKAG